MKLLRNKQHGQLYKELGVTNFSGKPSNDTLTPAKRHGLVDGDAFSSSKQLRKSRRLSQPVPSLRSDGTGTSILQNDMIGSHGDK